MAALQYKEYGKVNKIRGCIVTIVGLEHCINGQLVKFGYGTEGTIIGFDKEEAHVLLVKQKDIIKTGDTATMTLEPFNTPVGKNFIGRIINVLGEPLDNLGPIETDTYYPIFSPPPSVLERGIVNNTLETGIKILDTMIPIGKGQRQLILGDKMTGKTTIGTDIILNQRGKDLVCIYCCIGKGTTALQRVVNLFKSKGTFEYSLIVAALAGSSPGQQYLAPYVACSIGEYFMHRGGHVLIVFDDFTKHAWAYREISLLLDRPPGRESYPGDIFYLHSRMIERAAQLSKEKGGGSMTFFPIVELLEGDLTGYISTNLVSMTDGQIYLSAPLFGEGFKPAIDIGLSVSRIGNKAMWPALKKLSKSLRLEYLQYRDFLRVSRLKAGGAKTEGDIGKGGQILSDLLKQEKDAPLPMSEEVILFYGLSKKHLYDLDKQQIDKLMRNIYMYVKEKFPELIQTIEQTRQLDETTEKKLEAVYKEYIALLERESGLVEENSANSTEVISEPQHAEGRDKDVQTVNK